MTLSTCFSRDTVYFYGFPGAHESGFFNDDPPESEEILAARPLGCAGDGVRVVVFPGSVDPSIWRLAVDDLGMSLPDPRRVIVLPQDITPDLPRHAWSRRIRAELLAHVEPGHLVMAQPFLDAPLVGLYRFPPQVTAALNDKDNLARIVPERHLASRYARYANGDDLARSVWPGRPCALKVTASCAGAGVRLCHDPVSYARAQEDFRAVRGPIVADALLDVAREYDIEFVVPDDPSRPPVILGMIEQVIAPGHGFVGGVHNPAPIDPVSAAIEAVLRDEILPRARAAGWYGIGGMDVLVDADDRFYFVDPNFRMTALSPHALLVRNLGIRASVRSFFDGVFRGSASDFRRRVAPLARARSRRRPARHGAPPSR